MPTKFNTGTTKELLEIVSNEEKTKKVNYQAAGNIAMAVGTLILVALVKMVGSDPSPETILDPMFIIQALVGGLFIFGGYSILRLREEKVKGMTAKKISKKKKIENVPIEQ
jgi:hypothetical protein